MSRFGVEQDVDFVAASFIRTASDMRRIRAYIERIHEEVWGGEV